MPTILPITVLVRDLEALQVICRRRGWEFRGGQQRYRWFGHWLGDQPPPAGVSVDELGHCAHAIGVPGCLYEVGVLPRCGHYLLVWDDSPEGGLGHALGPGGGLLWQSYATEVVRRAVRCRGQRFRGHRDRTGTLRLRVVTGDCHSVAHVRISNRGDVSLWLFDPPGDFRSLADALGFIRSDEIVHVAADPSAVSA
jgi:hypothetical protein